MDSHATQSAFYNFIGWADANRKRLIVFAIALAVVAAIVAFIIYRRNAGATAASEALSDLRPIQVSPTTPGFVPAQEYLRLADASAKTIAGERALLLAGGALFTEGRYAEAFSQFEKLIAEYPDSALRAEAALGAAASLDAQGKIAEATTRYKAVTDRFAGSPSAIQAKFALARLYEGQNKPDLALKLYEEVEKQDQQGSIGAFYSKVCAANLILKNPSLKSPGISSPAVP